MYLNCHTYYSLRYGTLSPEQLVEQARERGVEQLALTDINNTTAIPEFIRRCRQYHIKPVAGMECRENGRLLYILLARDKEGLRQINAFRSMHNIGKTPLPPCFPPSDHLFVIYPLEGQIPGQAHPNVYIGIRPWELSRIARPAALASVLRPHAHRLAALHPVSFAGPGGYRLHCHLRAIEHNILLSRLQATDTARAGEYMQAGDRAAYRHFPQLLYAADKLLQACATDMDFTQPKNKQHFTGQADDDRALLQKLATEGLEMRYGKNNREAARRVENELDIIDRLGFSSYFLITWDIIRYSLSRSFYHVGRGSGANSTVAYCLRITNVDPIELDLYFERFINPKRSSPPDFDIDYSWKERDQVLDYIFKRYGREHTALLGTISTFRRRALTRELGKVYGLPREEIDALAGGREPPARPDAPTRRILELCEQLEGFPNLRSIHAGGVLISQEPICRYTALDMPPKGMPTTQWDMYTAEELGFEKIDILSQRGIGHINDCAALVRENRGLAVDVHRVGLFKQDEKTRALLRSGETTGCFYVESPAMRSLLQKLRCDHYTGLVAASSIIRPGVARSGMMQEYIRRFHLPPEQIEYLHPVMKEQLRETFGVMVYQEDVIKVCHHFAGLDLADADVLRRAMSGKYRSPKEMDRITQRFFDYSRRKGHPEALIQEVWRQIASFAGYAFSKAHSASFAVESFQSLYLKAHYPLEFLTAVINNHGGFYSPAVYLNEARKYGARIELPCINHSRRETRIRGSSIYLGLGSIDRLENQSMERICRERERQGPYTDLESFIGRTGIGLQQLILLLRIQAFRFTGIPREQLIWQAHLLTGRQNKPSASLFGERPTQQACFPEPESHPLQQALDEMELLGFPVSVSPFGLLAEALPYDILPARQMEGNGSRRARMAGWLVTIKYARTAHKEIMCFGCFIDREGDFFDTVHFPATLKAYPFRGAGVYQLSGKLENAHGHVSLRVQGMRKLPLASSQLRPGLSGRPGSSAGQVRPHP